MRHKVSAIDKEKISLANEIFVSLPINGSDASDIAEKVQRLIEAYVIETVKELKS